jgi:hypothetical protein
MEHKPHNAFLLDEFSHPQKIHNVLIHAAHCNCHGCLNKFERRMSLHIHKAMIIALNPTLMCNNKAIQPITTNVQCLMHLKNIDNMQAKMLETWG